LTGAFANVSITGAAPAGSVDVEFRLPEAAVISLELLDAQGRRVATLACGAWPAGRHRAAWSAARGVAPGLYLVRHRFPGGDVVRRITILR